MRKGWSVIGKKRIQGRGRLGCLWGLRGHKEAPEMLRRQCGARKCWRDQARSRGGGEGCRILFRPTVSFYRVRILTG